MDFKITMSNKFKKIKPKVKILAEKKLKQNQLDILEL